jgi:hypothetical protein
VAPAVTFAVKVTTLWVATAGEVDEVTARVVVVAACASARNILPGKAEKRSVTNRTFQNRARRETNTGRIKLRVGVAFALPQRIE